MPAPYSVVLTEEARRDVLAVAGYFAETEGEGHAIDFLESLRAVITSLSRFPERGSRPKALVDLGVRQYRQIVWRWYRLIYRVDQQTVMVYLIADGRRDMRTLLAQRLLNH